MSHTETLFDLLDNANRRIEAALAETKREVDAPDSFNLSHHPRRAWADGYTAASEAIRAALLGAVTE